MLNTTTNTWQAFSGYVDMPLECPFTQLLQVLAPWNFPICYYWDIKGAYYIVLRTSKACTPLCSAKLFMAHSEQTAILVFELSAKESDVSVC